MTGEDSVTQDDLVISKLLGQNLEKYRSLFPLVSAAVQLCEEDNILLKVVLLDVSMLTQHKNPLCRVASIDSANGVGGKLDYDKEKYKEMILNAAETVLGYFGFDRTVYGNKKNITTRKWRWLEN